MSDEINTRGEVADEADDEDDSIISLIDDEGRTSEYEILDAIETEEGALDDLFRERFKELYGDEDEEQSPEVDSLAGA